MNCPKCDGTRLKERRVKGKDLTVDVCPRCKGIWFERSELEKAMAVTGDPVRVPRGAAHGPSNCPECGKPLHTFPYPDTQVTVDACKKCNGLWLDAGEFRAIRRAREYLEQLSETREDADGGAIKTSLLQFIDAAIARLQE
jgi:Zn-finger nucleic acid-binding protein